MLPKTNALILDQLKTIINLFRMEPYLAKKILNQWYHTITDAIEEKELNSIVGRNIQQFVYEITKNKKNVTRERF